MDRGPIFVDDFYFFIILDLFRGKRASLNSREATNQGVLYSLVRFDESSRTPNRRVKRKTAARSNVEIFLEVC